MLRYKGICHNPQIIVLILVVTSAGEGLLQSIPVLFPIMIFGILYFYGSDILKMTTAEKGGGELISSSDSFLEHRDYQDCPQALHTMAPSEEFIRKQSPAGFRYMGARGKSSCLSQFGSFTSSLNHFWNGSYIPFWILRMFRRICFITLGNSPSIFSEISLLSLRTF